MWSSIRIRRSTQFALLLASMTVVACGDDPNEPEDPEPEVQTMTLTAGASTLTIDKSVGGPTPAGSVLLVPAGVATITASFRKADGSIETLVSGAEFDVRISPATGTPFTWTPSTNLGGTLTTSGVTSGQNIASTIDLFHREEAHADFGPFNFTIRIQ